MRARVLVSGLVLGLLIGTGALAAEFKVNMVNKDAEGRAMQFEPAFLKVAVGDTITFVATDKGHDSESLAGGIPEGTEGWKGKINQDVSVTVTAEGLYAYKCTPHVVLGMVGLIQVGDSTANADAITALKLPSKAKTRMAELLEQAEED